MSNQSDCKTESYTDEGDILFRYILSSYEKKMLYDISYDVINKYESSVKSKEFVVHKKPDYESLLTSLETFFTLEPGSYFLRLSTLSPKDAFYYLNRDSIDLDELSDNETSTEIKDSLNVLKVSSPMECIQVLLHSYRVLCELDDYKLNENAILLMPWKNIVHDTETRCYVNNKRLVAFSQYYTDCTDSYASVISITEFYRKVVDFVNDYITNNELTTLSSINNFVIDLSQQYDSTNIMMIELNTYDRNTDSCLFSWDEIDLMVMTELPINPIFRYMSDNKLVEIIM